MFVIVTTLLMTETDFRKLERLFLALGDKTRLRLLALMADGEVAVGFLADRLNESQPKVSRHLAHMRGAGIVNTRRDGKWIYYSINYPQDASQRQILETVVGAIAVMRIDGEYVYFTRVETGMSDVIIEDDSIYVEPYIYESADNYEEELEEDIDTEEEVIDEQEAAHNEMDVFLL
jgi:DNA-binding transcriptional ArsR family regulator